MADNGLPRPDGTGSRASTEPASGLGRSGFDPSRDKTVLLVSDEDKPLAYLELDDVALGRFCRSHLIAVEKAVHRSAGERELPLALAMSMHGAISLYRLAVEANAGTYELKHEGVEFNGEPQGDWTLKVDRYPNRLPLEVSRLVVAARRVAYEDVTPEALRELDEAAEAFAGQVLWDDEPSDSDGNPKGEKPQALSAQHDSAGPQDIAQGHSDDH